MVDSITFKDLNRCCPVLVQSVAQIPVSGTSVWPTVLFLLWVHQSSPKMIHAFSLKTTDWFLRLEYSPVEDSTTDELVLFRRVANYLYQDKISLAYIYCNAVVVSPSCTRLAVRNTHVLKYNRHFTEMNTQSDDRL